MGKKNKLIYIFAFLLFACAVGYLSYTGFAQNSVYFLNVAEAGEVPAEQLAQARLFGLVAQDGLAQQGNRLNFNLQDKDNGALVIPVVYSGALPDTFKAGAEVIVEGGMKQNGEFHASSIMTKCPSKYQKQNRKM